MMTMASCGNRSRSDSGNPQDDSRSPSSSSADEYQGNQQGLYVQCPMCGGTGIFDYMPGDIMAPKVKCEACSGTGQCDAGTAGQIQQMFNDINIMIDEGYDNVEGYISGRSASEIEYDLQKAYDLLESMRNDYINCSSGVLKAQYPSMIEQQEAKIAQLEAELRNAQ